MSHLRELHDGQRELLRREPGAAAKIAGGDVSAGAAEEVAVWVVICRALMNLDEFVTRE
jgi:hypothetical protein